MAGKKKGLGKGLEALLSGINPPASRVVDNQATAVQTLGDVQTIADGAKSSEAKAPLSPASEGSNIASLEALSPAAQTGNGLRVLQLPVEQCQRGQFQPRRAMDNEALEELASSITSQGVMQPIIVRKVKDGAGVGVMYEIVAGERRWRASQLAGLQRVPAIVRELDDASASAMALIENLQREDLNSMDQAHALARLQQEFALTHQQIADTVGKSRTAVSNLLRLLGLHSKVQQLLENGDLEMGHARALLSLDKEAQYKLARDVVNRCLSVRQAESLVKQSLKPTAANAQRPQAIAADANIERLENDLSEKLGVPVKIQHAASGSGQLVMKYHNLDELDGILEHIK